METIKYPQWNENGEKWDHYLRRWELFLGRKITPDEKNIGSISK